MVLNTPHRSSPTPSNLCSCHLQLSSSAVDLLNRIFVVDEDHRITIERVHALPFCLFYAMFHESEVQDARYHQTCLRVSSFDAVSCFR